jgi:hypothetical protein
MPLVIVESANVPTGQSFDGTMCDGNRLLPVRVMRINARTLLVEPTDLRAVRFRRSSCAHLAKALASLQQLAADLRPLTAESDEPELATEGLPAGDRRQGT